MPKLSQILFGKKPKMKKVETQTPEQKALSALIQQGLTEGKGAFGDIFGQFNQGEFEQGVVQPSLKNFQENILPAIQEKYIANNQLLGSDFARAQTKAGTDLQSNLAQLLYQAQQQHKQNRFGGLQTALGTQQFQNVYKPGSQGALGGFIQGVAGRGGEAVGSSLSNFFSGNQSGGGGGAPSLGAGYDAAFRQTGVPIAG